MAWIALLATTSCTTRKPPSPPPLDPASPAAARPAFTDVTDAAGVRFRHVNGAGGRKYLPETMGSGAALFDFDGDGRLDLYLVNGRPLPGAGRERGLPMLLRNRGDGTFADVTAGSGLEQSFYGMGCAAGDYDGDGRIDLFVTACLDGNRLYRNLGGSGGGPPGRFRDVTATAGVGDKGWGTSAAWLDYDRDGWIDLFVCRYVHYRLGESDRDCFAPDGSRMYCDPRKLPPDTCLLYRNEGGGRFRDVSAETGIAAKAGKALGVAVGDLDDDGWPDLFVANDTEPNFLFRNVANGDGRRFDEIGLESGVAMPENGEPRAGMGIDLADIENDGRWALLVSNFSGEGLSLYHQERPRAASFIERAFEAGLGAMSLNRLGFGLLFIDYDLDGRLDAVVVNGHVQPDVGRYSAGVSHAERKLLFRNEGQGRFREVGASLGGPFARETVGRGVAAGDLDDDGDLDLVVTNNAGPVEVLRNEIRDGGPHWLQLRLRGAPPNIGALGARVTVRTGTLVQRRMVRTGSSYLCQSDTRLHFGLGTAATVDEVEVRWPDGRVSRLRAVGADRIVTLNQPP